MKNITIILSIFFISTVLNTNSLKAQALWSTTANSYSTYNLGIGQSSADASFKLKIKFPTYGMYGSAYYLSVVNPNGNNTFSISEGQSIVYCNLAYNGTNFARFSNSTNSDASYVYTNMQLGKTDYSNKFVLYGIDNNGTISALKIMSPNQTMLIDGDEIDAVSTPLYLNYNSGQRVVIGNTAGLTDSKLTVDGKITCEEVEVKAVTGADFVFGKDYKLMNLRDLEKYLNENKHLPDVPSAEETSQGVNIGDFSILLLQKIEELTLYTIEQQKSLEAQKVLLEEQQKQIEELMKLFRK